MLLQKSVKASAFYGPVKRWSVYVCADAAGSLLGLSIYACVVILSAVYSRGRRGERGDVRGWSAREDMSEGTQLAPSLSGDRAWAMVGGRVGYFSGTASDWRLSMSTG